MIIEIMLIILAMISVIVNTIVSVIIIKDVKNKSDRLIVDNEKRYSVEEMQDYLKELQKKPIITINPNNVQPNDKLHYAYATEQNKSEVNTNVAQASTQDREGI